MARFDGQVAIVTGAGGGLGRTHALLLAANGAKVVVNDYGGDTVGGQAGASASAEAVVAEILAAGGQAVADSRDVALEGAAVVQTALDAFGGIHIVVNNAGIATGGEFPEIAEKAYERTLDIHLGGTLAVTRAAWPIFKAQQYGRVVNTSSSSLFGIPYTSAYITAKGGIFGLTRAIAGDGRRWNIKVNAVMPTAYSRLTALSPELGPIMKAGFPPEQVSTFVGALAHADVPVSGETFVVGGGRAARVVLGTVPGISGMTSIDDALARFDEVMNTDDIVVPRDAMVELRYQCEHIGLDLSELMP